LISEYGAKQLGTFAEKKFYFKRRLMLFAFNKKNKDREIQKK